MTGGAVELAVKQRARERVVSYEVQEKKEKVWTDMLETVQPGQWYYTKGSEVMRPCTMWKRYVNIFGVASLRVAHIPNRKRKRWRRSEE